MATGILKLCKYSHGLFCGLQKFHYHLIFFRHPSYQMLAEHHILQAVITFVTFWIVVQLSTAFPYKYYKTALTVHTWNNAAHILSILFGMNNQQLLIHCKKQFFK